MSRKVLSLLTIVAVTVCVSHAATVPDFDSYIPVVESLSNFADKLRILQAVWSQIQSSYPDDHAKYVTLYDQVLKLISDGGSMNENEEQAAKQLQQAMSRYGIQQNQQFVAEIINGKQFPLGNALNYLTELNGLNIAVKSKIYEVAIDQVYGFQQPETIAAILYYLRDYVPLEDVARAQIYLYREFLARGDVNNEYLLSVTYYFAIIKRSLDYDSLDLSTKMALEKAISHLPETLQQLDGKPYTCLLNKQHEEFMYSTYTINIDSNSSYVFTWTNKYEIGDNGRWTGRVVELDNENQPQLKLLFYIRNHLLKRYAYLKYLDDGTNLIAAWNTENELPENAGITVVFVGDALVLSVNDYLVCATEQLFTENRRYVGAFLDDEHTSQTPACQWIAHECP